MTTIFPTRLSHLKLTHFRNYRTLTLCVDAKPVVLAGPNGAGKTNLLEAVSFLSPGRGLRRAQYGDVGLAPEKGGDGSWAIATTLETGFGTVEVGTGLSFSDHLPDKTRRIRIDRVAAKSAEDLLEHVRVLWLTPAMDGLFTGPAGDRRRFLDRFVLAIDPTHAKRVSAFDKAVRNRNRILEDAPSNSAWLDACESQVAELGMAISAARHELMSLLQAEIQAVDAAKTAFPRATLTLEGTVEALLSEQTAVDAEETYRQRLRENRPRDARAGRTLDGPHRADLLVHHEEKQMPARLCSTGEQKALLIGLVLAHARLTARLSGMIPLILLDEVAAHLDQHRRAALFDIIADLNCQAWMTGTDTALFDSLGDRAHHFHVENGTVSPV